jgi:transmembrane sensor
LIEKNEHIDDLIGLAITGQASAAEIAELNAWIAESEQHQQYYLQMESLFVNASNASMQEDFDTDKAWLKVQSELKPETKVVTLNPTKRSAAFWKYAAAASVIVAIVGIVLFSNNGKTVEFAMNSGDAVLKDTLPGGVVASLNKQSQLTIEYNEKKGKTHAKLTGQAHFDIVHDASREFVIETQDVFIRDIGTVFSVLSEPDNDSIMVVVTEGEVSFYKNNNAGITVTAGEAGVYYKPTGKFSKLNIEAEESLENAAGFADKNFRFRNASMIKVLERINEAYGSDLRLDAETMGRCRITVSFNNEELSTIINVIAETMGWTVSRQGEVYSFGGETCP